MQTCTCTWICAWYVYRYGCYFVRIYGNTNAHVYIITEHNKGNRTPLQNPASATCPLLFLFLKRSTFNLSKQFSKSLLFNGWYLMPSWSSGGLYRYHHITHPTVQWWQSKCKLLKAQWHAVSCLAPKTASVEKIINTSIVWLSTRILLPTWRLL